MRRTDEDEDGKLCDVNVFGRYRDDVGGRVDTSGRYDRRKDLHTTAPAVRVLGRKASEDIRSLSSIWQRTTTTKAKFQKKKLVCKVASRRRTRDAGNPTDDQRNRDAASRVESGRAR